LIACRDYFSIDELFDEDDLLELQNFPAVLRLLSQLSRNSKSRQLGLKFYFHFNQKFKFILFRPFPEETILPTDLIVNESIYCNLKEEVDQHYKQLGSQQYSILNKKEENDWVDEKSGQEIYDSICSQKVPRNKSLPIVIIL
jgi:hypothetical protein